MIRIPKLATAIKSDLWICRVWRVRLKVLKGVGVGLHDKVLGVGVEDVGQGHDVVEGSIGEGLLLVRGQPTCDWQTIKR